MLLTGIGMMGQFTYNLQSGNTHTHTHTGHRHGERGDIRPKGAGKRRRTRYVVITSIFSLLI